jgi:hypothetical protein
VTSKIGPHFLIGSIIGYASKGTFHYTFLSGVAFGTAKLVDLLAEPLFTKISDPELRATVKTATRLFVIVSIKSNPALGLTACSVHLVVKICFIYISKRFSTLDKKDLNSWSSVAVKIILVKNDVTTGLFMGGLTFSARVICTTLYPYFKTQAEKFEIYNNFTKDFPEGWGLACTKIFIETFTICYSILPIRVNILNGLSLIGSITYFHYLFDYVEKNPSEFYNSYSPITLLYQSYYKDTNDHSIKKFQENVKLAIEKFNKDILNS